MWSSKVNLLTTGARSAPGRSGGDLRAHSVGGRHSITNDPKTLLTVANKPFALRMPCTESIFIPTFVVRQVYDAV